MDSMLPSVSTASSPPTVSQVSVGSVSTASTSSPTTPSPELVASVVEALKAPLASMVNSALQAARVESTPSAGAGPSTGSSVASSSMLDSRTSQLAQAGSSLPWAPIVSSPSSIAVNQTQPPPSGMSPLIVPSFVPQFSVAGSTNHQNSSSVALPSSVNSVPGCLLANTPPLNQPFVVGPGYSPIPYKVVSQIVAGKYVNLEDLLPENISIQEPEPQLHFDGRLILSNAPKKNKKQITEIVSWVEAFTIYSLIIGKFFPNRLEDLLKYKLLILRTYRQFSGSAWLNYDREFREVAAAEKCTCWSSMNVQLYNFHTAGAQVRPRAVATTSGDKREAQGSATSKILCHSWNAGACIAPSMACRFRHACSSCEGEHRKISCPGQSSKPHRLDRSYSAEPSESKRRKHR